MRAIKQLIKLWGPILAVLLIPIILININVIQSTYRIEANTKEQYLNQTERSAMLISTSIEESILDADRLLLIPDIQALKSVTLNKSNSDYTKILTAMNIVRSAFQTNLDYDLGIFFNKGQLLIANATIYLDINSIYDQLFHIASYDQDAFIEIAQTNKYGLTFYPMAKNQISADNSEGILYSRPISIYNDSNYGGACFVNLRKSFWDTNLPYSSETDSINVVIDDTGKILYSTSQEELKFNFEALTFDANSGLIMDESMDSDFIGAYAKTKFGLTILSIRPRSAVLYPVAPLVKLSWGLNITAIILFILIILLAALIFSKKLKFTARLLSNSKTIESNDIFAYMNEAILDIKQTAEHLSIEQLKQQALLKEVFWDRALNNIYTDTLNNVAIKSGIRMSNDELFCVLMLKISEDLNAFTYDGLNEISQFRERLVQGFQDLYNVSSVGVEQIIILFPISNAEFYKYEVDECISNIIETDNLKIYYACSPPFSDMRDFYSHYYSCRNVMNSANIKAFQVSWSELTEIQDNNYIFFPDELEMQMSNAIRSGDKEALKNSYRKIAIENFIDKSLSQEMLGLLSAKFKLLILTVYHSDMPHSLDYYLQLLNESQTESSTFSDAYSVLNQMCEFYAENQDSKTNQQIEIFENYIDENYSDQNLSITSTASHFGYSESYFSRMFKDVMGINFSVYLEQKRLQKADEQIASTNDSIEQIAEAVGYSSSGSFRRAYRRFFSLTPSQRRQNIP